MTASEKHGAPWSSSDIQELLSMKRRQIGRKAIAAQLGRTEAAIEAKLSKISGGSPFSIKKRNLRRFNGARFFLS